MKKVKAIFLDMDGTLLHENNRASKTTADVISKLRGAGYRVFLATGRAYEEIHMLIPEGLKFDGIISSNGTLGHINDKVLFEHDLSEAAVKSIVDVAKKAGIYYEVFPFNEPRFALTEDQTWMLNMVQGEKPQQVAESEWLSRHEAIKGKLTWRHEIPQGLAYSKIYLFHPELQTIEAFRNEMYQQQDRLKIEVSNSTHNNVETMKYGINKGTGIKEMCEHYNIDIGHTLVMGDSDNDRTMFEVGAYTVAMKNAKPHIKSLTQYETEFDNNEDGAALFLEKYLL
ncbi:HAD family hydrolase [Staphylococcus agnetis]|uniref:HAD family hydrolase n=1 Tax=Staphylococcus agnetis TaxID=985762 RepID=UPI000CD044EE|nr:HAD family hydrolase [Staphylococcus agnetis]MBY7665023.1 Cof-type HAD-IIB family hydrolase [Staphylococcus agnetis]NJH67573.1 Cof-type HAD-IIB family hydrolase [Staphylococcus agnetis]NJH77992.1 Cof-type HAD-IIB family hydrolase [Staphylococcus agnetis]PNY84924.1 Cof-type HAD-IIB family hydrolase [Staphylococcus agnetis]PTH65165.1 HAD family phosphatase [Staphylococcus agnetis]